MDTNDFILQNPVNKGMDYAFVDALMTGVMLKHFPEVKSVVSVRHVRHKRRVGKFHSTFIYSYYLEGRDRNDKPIYKHLIYSSHTDGSRLYAYTILTLLIDSGFNNDDLQVIAPLEYFDDIKTFVYEAVKGKTLYRYFEERTPVTTLTPLLDRAAAWISKFHKFALTDSQKKNIKHFDSSYMNWRLSELLDLIRPINSHQAQKFEDFLNAFAESETRLGSAARTSLVYGDLHPENIITDRLDAHGLIMIDFTDVSLGDELRDVGSFIQQVNFMGRKFYTIDELESARTKFIECYFDKPFSEIPTDLLQRINLYQAWNSVRGFVYFFPQRGSEEKSYGLLEDAWRYLALANEARRDITLRY